MKKWLFDNLKEYSDSNFYPFHMPGHKRSPESGSLAKIYKYDITEIDGFDNLHQPESVIKDAQERAAKLYRSEETYFLINGSTSGILSAVSAVAERAGKLIIARNCHKAVYHAAFLNRMKLYYAYPEHLDGYDMAGPITVGEIEKVIKDILDDKEVVGKKADEVIAGIVITSPTYEGIISDVSAISDLVHGYGIPLIVDQAHGAHFGIHPAYPKSAVSENADIVIHSVHKTLPAPTQTALIHRNGKIVDKETLEKYLRIYQSSSPSYLLMAGIDEAVRLAGTEGYQRLGKLCLMKNSFLKKLEACRHIRVCSLTEPGKLVICLDSALMTGQMFYDILREKYHLQMEMASRNYVVAILTMMDEESGFDRLLKALLEIDSELDARSDDKGFILGCDTAGAFSGIVNKKEDRLLPYDFSLKPVAALDLWEAYTLPHELVEFAKAQERVSAEFINFYPPGIPLLAPGEVLNDEMIELIQRYIVNGYMVQGVYDEKIKVLKL